MSQSYHNAYYESALHGGIHYFINHNDVVKCLLDAYTKNGTFTHFIHIIFILSLKAISDGLVNCATARHLPCELCISKRNFIITNTHTPTIYLYTTLTLPLGRKLANTYFLIRLMKTLFIFSLLPLLFFLLLQKKIIQPSSDSHSSSSGSPFESPKTTTFANGRFISKEATTPTVQQVRLFEH